MNNLPPLQVAQLDLDGPDGEVLHFGPAPDTRAEIAAGEVFALVRLRGRPVATVVCRVPPGRRAADAVAAEARALLARNAPRRPAAVPDGTRALSRASPRDPVTPGPLSTPVRPPRTSVVVYAPTLTGAHDPRRLARALDSLCAQDHPDFEIVVVDNGPSPGDTGGLIEREYPYALHHVAATTTSTTTIGAGVRIRYAREEAPGRASAHNRGVAVADGEVVAFAGDDTVADPHWLTALTEPFAADPGLGCATGLVLPALLCTAAQILPASRGGLAGGFEPRLYDPARPPSGAPLLPFVAAAATGLGSGVNMAFRAGALRAVGGFDPATGAGTPAGGGDELYAFVRVVAAGHRLRHTPEALLWHHRRESWQDFRNRTYDHGSGLTAGLTALLVRRPGLLPALLRGFPSRAGGARPRAAHADFSQTARPGAREAPEHPWPRPLARLERRGMLAGPLGYAKARHRVRGVRPPWHGPQG